MAILCPDFKILFIMVPATGCSAVGGVLRKQFGGVWLPERDLIRDGRILVGRKHCSLDQLIRYGALSEQARQELLVVATVRNPFDRIVSYYQKLAGGRTPDPSVWTKRFLDAQNWTGTGREAEVGRVYDARTSRRVRRGAMIRSLGFNNWVKISLLRWRALRSFQRRTNGPVRYEEAFPLLGGVDVAIRFEHLEEGLGHVFRMAGSADPISVPHRNATQGKAPFADYYDPISRRLMENTFRHDLAAMGYRFDGPMTSGSLVHLKPAGSLPLRV